MIDTQRIRPVLGLSLAAAMIALTACGSDDDRPSKTETSQEPSSPESPSDAEQAAGPDLEGIPDVVAEVNGEEVTKEEFVPLYEAQYQQAAVQAQSGGEQPDEEALKAQTADNLVNTELLAQEAAERGIEVSEQDVEDALAVLAKENQLGSTEELIAAIEKQGATEEQARSQLQSQLVIEQLVADEAGSVRPTDRELRKTYDQAKQQQAQAGKQAQPLPPFAKVKSQIAEQAKSDKMAEVAQALVDELRQDAEITVNL